MQHDEDFPHDVDGSAALSAVGLADVNRPTLLLTDEHVETVRNVYELLATPAVLQDRSLQVALRRFVFAGSKALPEDRLIDLNICAEALFIQRNKIKTMQKAKTVAMSGGRLLADDLVLAVDRGTVEQILMNAYVLRNAEIHGGHTGSKAMTLLGGDKTTNLAHFVEDLTRLMGRAIQLVLTELTQPQHGQPKRPA